MRGSIIADVSALLLDLEIDPKAIFAQAKIDAVHLADRDMPVRLADLLELLELAADRAGIEDFGLRLAQRRGVPDLGPVSLILRAQESVRGALLALGASLHLHSDAHCVTLIEENDEPLVLVGTAGGGAGRWRQVTDVGLASVVQVLRWLIGDDWSPKLLCVSYARPNSIVAHERFFRCPIEHQHEFDGLVLRREDVEREIPGSSPMLRRQMNHYLASFNADPGRTYVYWVERVVASSLSLGNVSVELVAQRLGTNRRTLNRRLGQYGLNFSAVVEDVRRAVATQHLHGSNRAIVEVADLVGFDSASAFTHWFSRSFGTSPARWRHNARMSQFDNSMSQ